MKFIIQQVHQEQIEIDIPQDTTLKQLRKLLVSQYSFPDQQMKFINNGIILKDPGALKNVEELGRIIVFIKNKDSKKSHKQSNAEQPKEDNKADQEKNPKIEEKPEKKEEEKEKPKPTPEDTNKEQDNPIPKDIEPKPTGTFDTSNKSISENANIQYNEPFELAQIPNLVDPESLYFNFGKRRYNDSQSIPDIPKERLDSYISDCFKKIHLKQLYDEKCNFYANLNETKRIADMIENNPGLILVVSQFTNENFSVAMRRNTIDFGFAMDIAGFISSTPIDIADDYEAAFMEMPTIYVQTVKKLMRKYNKSQRETVKAFVDSSYNEDEAEKLLQS